MSQLRSFLRLSLLMLPAAAFAQIGSPTCTITAVNPVLHAEGVTEQLGDFVFTCTGTPGRDVTGNLAVSINTTVTNRILSTGAVDVALSVNGSVANVPGMLAGTNQVTFSGLRIPFDANGNAQLRLSNLRADASFGGAPSVPAPFGSGQFIGGQSVIAQLSFSPGGILNFTTTNFPIGVPQRGLFATSLSTLVPTQRGSALPETVSFTELIRAGTLFASTRISEGFPSSFEPRKAGADTGTRIMVRFSGYPADARLFVPALIAGSDAATPTVAGDFGGTVSPGQYVPGSGTLFLVRVQGTDTNGAGGFYAPSDSFDAMTEVTLNNGAGSAVYEVFDADPSRSESAQIPVFIGLPRSASPRAASLSNTVSFGPTSTSSTANGFSPVPRFANVSATADCSMFRDCGAYLPKLGAPPLETQFRLLQGVGVTARVIGITNEGGGLMPWVATVEYKNGSGWIRLDPESELNARPIRLTIIAKADMAPGVYDATVVVDAGAAGVARYPISLTVVAIPASAPTPRVTSVVHGATFAAGPVARNSFVTLKGENLNGNTVAVTFDGKPAKVVYTSATQINLLVPSDLTSNTAQIVVTVNGTAAAPITVMIAAANPGLFTPGILNQDGSVNTPENPANTGTYVAVYGTGLLTPEGTGVIDAKIHDVTYSVLPYAGPAPGIPGLQQVNLLVPVGYPTMTTEIVVCTTATGTRTCSPPVKIHIRKAQ